MNGYRTITSQLVELGHLDVEKRKAASQLMAIYGAARLEWDKQWSSAWENEWHEQCAERETESTEVGWGFELVGGKFSVFRDYLSEARKSLWEGFRHRQTRLRVLSGPVGEVFRDGYYRLVALEICCKWAASKAGGAVKKQAIREKVQKTIVNNLRYSPIRPLLDRYLDEGVSQKAFASSAGLDPGSLSAAFRSLFNPEQDNRIGVKRLGLAFRRLSLTPLAGRAEPPAPPVDQPAFGKAASSLTTRERLLVRIAADVAPLEDPVEREKRVASNVLLLFGPQDAVALDAVTSELNDEITQRSEPTTDLTGVLEAAPGKVAATPCVVVSLMEGQDELANAYVAGLARELRESLKIWRSWLASKEPLETSRQRSKPPLKKRAQDKKPLKISKTAVDNITLVKFKGALDSQHNQNALLDPTSLNSSADVYWTLRGEIMTGSVSNLG